MALFSMKVGKSITYMEKILQYKYCVKSTFSTCATCCVDDIRIFTAVKKYTLKCQFTHLFRASKNIEIIKYYVLSFCKIHKMYIITLSENIISRTS